MPFRAVVRFSPPPAPLAVQSQAGGQLVGILRLSMLRHGVKT